MKSKLKLHRNNQSQLQQYKTIKMRWFISEGTQCWTYGFSVGQVGTRQCEISRPPTSENEPFVLFLFQLAFHERVVLLHKPWRSLRVITQKAVPLLSRPVEFEYVEEPILLQLQMQPCRLIITFHHISSTHFNSCFFFYWPRALNYPDPWSTERLTWPSLRKTCCRISKYPSSFSNC